MPTLAWRPIQSVEDFRSVVRLNETSESITFDFKRQLHGAGMPKNKGREKQEAQKELCRDVCQFANTFGGTLLYGIEEGQVGGRRVAVGYRPLDSISSIQQWILQAVRKYLVPATIRLDFQPITTDGGEILAVNIAPSEHLVSLWDEENGRIECLRRTAHGKEYMNPDELQRHLMDTGRCGMLVLRRLRSEVGRDDVSLMSGVFEARATGHAPRTEVERLTWPVYLGQMYDDEFELRIPNLSAGFPTVTIPYGLIRHVWKTADGKLGILLGARIVFYGGRDPILEPT